MLSESEFQKIRNNPNAQKLAATLVYAEHSKTGDDVLTNPEIYNKSFGYPYNTKELDLTKPHPDEVYCIGEYCSAAAGAFQFMPDTWAAVVGENTPMTIENQLKATFTSIKDAGVDPTKPLTREAVARLAPIWASLPMMNGQSRYGQPVKSWSNIIGVYNRFKPKKWNERTKDYLDKQYPSSTEAKPKSLQIKPSKPKPKRNRRGRLIN